jgi:hypothetical protein
MASMKKLMLEHYPDASNTSSLIDYNQSHDQRMMNHHSAKAMDMSRMSRNHAIHADTIQNDDTKGQHTELARAYGCAAKAHLSLADHHAAQFKKERTDTVKDMTKPIKQPSMTTLGKGAPK